MTGKKKKSQVMTFCIKDDLKKRAKYLALKRETSVSQILVDFLEEECKKEGL